MTLLHEHESNTRARLAQAWTDYYAMVNRNLDPEPGDADRLPAVMGELRITDEKLRADVRASNEAGQLRAEIRTPDELESIRQSVAAYRGRVEADLRGQIEKALPCLPLDVLLWLADESGRALAGGNGSALARHDHRMGLARQAAGEIGSRVEMAHAASNAARARLRELARQFPGIVVAGPND